MLTDDPVEAARRRALEDQMYGGGMGGQIRGLLDQFQPTQADRDAARKAQLQTFFLSLLGTQRGNEFGALGRGGLLANAAYNQTLDNSQKAAMERMQAAGMAMKLREGAQQFQDLDEQRQALGATQFQQPASPMQSAMQQAPSLSPTMQNVASVQQAAAQTPAPGLYERKLAEADALDKWARDHKSVAVAKQAEALREQAYKYAPQYDGTETLMQNGKPVVVQKFKNQAAQTLPGYQPKPDYKQLDTGGKVGFYDPLTNSFGGQFDKTMTPGEVASDVRGQESNAISRGHLGIDQARLGLERQRLSQDNLSQPFEVSNPQGQQILVQQDKRTGNLLDVNTRQQVTGVSPKMPTQQQNDLQDVRQTKATLDSLIKSFKPEYVGLKGNAGDFKDQYISQAIPGVEANPDRVQFRQNAAIVVNNYIKQVTGATVGQNGEQQRLMQAVPALNDSPGVYQAKMLLMQKNLDKLPAIIANNPNLRGGAAPQAAPAQNDPLGIR